MRSSQGSAATLRLAKARLRWRRAADELLIGAIFEELNIVRRDGDCFGRAARQAVLTQAPMSTPLPALMPALLPAMAPAPVRA